MKTVRVTIDPAVSTALELGRIDTARVDATTGEEIATQRAPLRMLDQYPNLPARSSGGLGPAWQVFSI